MDERRLSMGRTRSYSITPSIDTIRLDPCLPLPLHDTVLNDLVPRAKDFALSHGIGMRIVGSVTDDTMQFLPFMLLPSSFPTGEFEKAKEVQKDINELIHKVAHDHEFLKNSLKGVIDGEDDFTSNVYRIYETVRNEGYAQPLSLGILRSDYLLDNEMGSDNTADLVIKQVEINTISCSFGAITTKLNDLYKFIFQDIGYEDALEKFAESNALKELASGLVEAWKLYDNPEAGILVLIEETVVNICDQRLLEFEIKEQAPNIRILRRTYADLVARAKLQPDKSFVVDCCEIGVVYSRTGYAPTQIPTASDWDMILQMERSTAIKCPSAHYHLAGTKKIQQVLAQPGMLERFYPDDKEKVERIRSVFTGLYSLEMNEDGNKTVEMAMVRPGNFVLKPQREGGGNNMYGKDIKNFLYGCRNSQKRAGYILMDRIRTPLQKNYLLRAGHPPELTDVINELGVFGVIIGDDKKIITNKECGHLLRTKPSSVNEGGVAAGFGAVDGVFLV